MDKVNTELLKILFDLQPVKASGATIVCLYPAFLGHVMYALPLVS